MAYIPNKTILSRQSLGAPGFKPFSFISDLPNFKSFGDASQWEGNKFTGNTISGNGQLNPNLARQRTQLQFEGERDYFNSIKDQLGDYFFTPSPIVRATQGGRAIENQLGGTFLNRINTQDVIDYYNNPQVAFEAMQDTSATPKWNGWTEFYPMLPEVYKPASEVLFPQLDAQVAREGTTLGAGSFGNYFIDKSGNISQSNYTPEQLNQIAGYYSQYYNKEANEINRQRDKGRGFLSKVGPLLKTAVPLAIGAIATAGIGSALGAGSLLGSTALSTGVSAGNAAAGSSFLGGLGSSFVPRAALSGALQGGIGGFLSGGDFSGALKGAGLGGLTGGFGSAIGQGLGLSGLGLNTFQNALTGASGGLAQGDLRSAGLGALLGGASGYIRGGGEVPGLGRIAGAPMTGGLQGPTQGEGVLGSLTRGLGMTTGGTSMFGNNKNLLSGAMRIGGALYEQGQQEDANEEIRRRMMQAQQDAQAQLQQAQGMFNPYAQAGTQASNQLMAALQAGFSPQDLASDEGYQFRLNQGQNALQRQMAASGLGQSGAALKAAQEYGQGLAAQEYQDAYDRWLAQNSQLAGQAGMGLGAIGQQAGLQQGIAGLTSDMGGIEAQILAANAANRQRSLSEILGGLGSIFGV